MRSEGFTGSACGHGTASAAAAWNNRRYVLCVYNPWWKVGGCCELKPSPEEIDTLDETLKKKAMAGLKDSGGESIKALWPINS
jgi:hypothetical protein